MHSKTLSGLFGRVAVSVSHFTYRFLEGGHDSVQKFILDTFQGVEEIIFVFSGLWEVPEHHKDNVIISSRQKLLRDFGDREKIKNVYKEIAALNQKEVGGIRILTFRAIFREEMQMVSFFMERCYIVGFKRTLLYGIPILFKIDRDKGFKRYAVKDPKDFDLNEMVNRKIFGKLSLRPKVEEEKLKKLFSKDFLDIVRDLKGHYENFDEAKLEKLFLSKLVVSNPFYIDTYDYSIIGPQRIHSGIEKVYGSRSVHERFIGLCTKGVFSYPLMSYLFFKTVETDLPKWGLNKITRGLLDRAVVIVSSIDVFLALLKLTLRDKKSNKTEVIENKQEDYHGTIPVILAESHHFDEETKEFKTSDGKVAPPKTPIEDVGTLFESAYTEFEKVLEDVTEGKCRRPEDVLGLVGEEQTEVTRMALNLLLESIFLSLTLQKGDQRRYIFPIGLAEELAEKSSFIFGSQILL